MKRCTRCGRLLKNPKSVVNGMGPVCYRKWKASLDSQETGNILLTGDYGDDVVLERRGNRIATNVPSVRVLHSPTGFEWGYGGSGPADLALNILLKYGVAMEVAEVLHQDFKWEYIAGIPKDGAWIRGFDIRQWIMFHTQTAPV